MFATLGLVYFGCLNVVLSVFVLIGVSFDLLFNESALFVYVCLVCWIVVAFVCLLRVGL